MTMTGSVLHLHRLHLRRVRQTDAHRLPVVSKAVPPAGVVLRVQTECVIFIPQGSMYVADMLLFPS